MCTLTWYLKEKEYAVFFNRDEKKQRQTAIPPKIDSQYKYIMPIDPDGQGTWIGVNQFGYSFCLLNNYQVGAAQVGATSTDTVHNVKAHLGQDFKSRGKLIPAIIGLDSFADIRLNLNNIQAEQFRPFLLAIFAPELIFSQQPKVAIYSWNGKVADFVELPQPIISTSVNFTQANQHRASLFKALTANNKGDAELHYQFHHSHLPEPGPLSVCMHREDASSVSFSHILVGQEIQFSYQGLAPCQGQMPMKLILQNQSKYFG